MGIFAGKDKPVILLIDTATQTTSVALTHGERLVAHRVSSPEQQGQASALLAPMVDSLLQTVRAEGLRLDAVALSAGPGSYTGLRVGSSLAKGLCFGFGIPLIASSTLEIMVEQLRAERKTLEGEELRIYPMIDARRMEVYTACFDASGKRLSPDEPLILSAEEPLSELSKYKHYFIGDGASKVEGLWEMGDYEIHAHIRPDAQYMRLLALRAYHAGGFVDLAYWTPNYLKEYVATIGKNKVLHPTPSTNKAKPNA